MGMYFLIIWIILRIYIAHNLQHASYSPFTYLLVARERVDAIFSIIINSCQSRTTRCRSDALAKTTCGHRQRRGERAA